MNFSVKVEFLADPAEEIFLTALMVSLLLEISKITRNYHFVRKCLN